MFIVFSVKAESFRCQKHLYVHTRTSGHTEKDALIIHPWGVQNPLLHPQMFPSTTPKALITVRYKSLLT